MGFLRIFFIFLLFVSAVRAKGRKPTLFDVRTYGARGDGVFDNTKAFLEAWKHSCDEVGGAELYVPVGTYMLGAIQFIGHCKGPISFVLQGNLKAPKDPYKIKQEWIVFRYVERLSVSGGGTLDGQGHSSWPVNDCQKNPNCPALAINVAFQFVNDSSVDGINSINSKMGHISVFASNRLTLTNIKISAPKDSPNTDGIKIGSSSEIRIFKTNIATGDDCIAILGGTTNIDVSDVTCGPGHGISVGGLGRSKGEKDLVGLSVRNSRFVGSTNGVRIKTWPDGEGELKVSGLVFRDLEMVDVANPIVIDQKYCPVPPCPKESDSRVQIKDAIFDHIWGTSATKVAVKIHCSKRYPCPNIQLKNIDLVYKGRGGPAVSQCHNAYGRTFNKQNPSGCLGK